jgi:Zn-dependent peptidase ImmA (M78 family)
MLSFEIPDKIKVGGIVYHVVLADDWLGRDGTDGMVEDSNNTIYINQNLSREFQAITFIHEVLHCCNSTVNHEFLDSLSEQLYQIFADNNFKFTSI